MLLAAGLGSSLPSDHGNSQPAAIVNGETIPVDLVLEMAHGCLEGPGPLSVEYKRQAWKTLLDGAIDNLLMQQFLTKNGITIDPNALKKQMSELGTQWEGIPQLSATFLQWEIYAKKQLSDSLLKSYYRDNKVVFDKTMVRASHICLYLSQNSSPRDRKAASVKLEAIRRKILGGKIEFAQAAEKYSECPSKNQAGDVGFFRRKGDVYEPFAEAAFALKVGDVSDMVATEAGLHLIRVTERRGQTSDFEEAKEDVRAYCAQELYEEILREQRKTARIKIFPAPPFFR